MLEWFYNLPFVVTMNQMNLPLLAPELIFAHCDRLLLVSIHREVSSRAPRYLEYSRFGRVLSVNELPD